MRVLEVFYLFALYSLAVVLKHIVGAVTPAKPAVVTIRVRK